MSPHTAWQILQGIETLPLRMERHVANTRKVVAFLARHADGRQSIAYPELESHPDHALAKQLLPRGCGAVFSFDLKGDRAAGQALHRGAAGSSRTSPTSATPQSLVIHPAIDHALPHETTRRSPQAGIGPGTIRLSIGLEDADDLIDDLNARAASGWRRERRRVRLRRRCQDTAYAPTHTAAGPFDRRLPCTVASVHGAATTTASGHCERAGSPHHGYAVLAPDLPGHGRAAARRSRASRTLADWTDRAARRGAVSRPRRSSGTAWARWSRSRRRRVPAKRVSHLVLVATAYLMRARAALLDGGTHAIR